MKTNYVRNTFLLVAVACVSIASVTLSRAGSDYGTAQLRVWRAADFGSDIYLNLSIDGVKVTSLGRNQGYTAELRPGRHILTVSNSPSPYGKTKMTHKEVTFHSGQNYPYTAIWEANDIKLLNGKLNDQLSRSAY